MQTEIETLRAELATTKAELRDSLDANEKAKVSEFHRGRRHMRAEAAAFSRRYLDFMASFDGTPESSEIVRAMARALSEYLNA